MHVDQNEKLVVYAVDRYSGMILGFASMPTMNNVIMSRAVHVSTQTHLKCHNCTLIFILGKLLHNTDCGTRLES